MMERSYFSYFISTYIIFVIAFGIILITQDSIDLVDKTILILGMPFVFSLFVAPLLYYAYPPKDSHYRARKNRKKVLKEFIEKHHFKISENNYLVGTINDFHLTIHAERSKSMMHEWIEITIFFNAKRKSEFIPVAIMEEIQRKYTKENVTWFMNSALIKQYYVHMPKYSQIYMLLQRCITDLKSQQIAPIAISEWKQMLPETKAYYNPPENI